MKYATGTLYVFMEKESDNLIARTADVRVLEKFKNSEWIATGEPLLIKNVEYLIEHFVIDLLSDSSNLFQPNSDGYDFGDPAYYSVQLRIFVKAKK